MKHKQKNPIVSNKDNIRRWAYLNVPKFQNKDYNSIMIIDTNNLLKTAIKYFNLFNRNSASSANFAITEILYPASSLYEFIHNYGNFSKFQKQNMWRYYMSDLDKLKHIYSIKSILWFNYNKSPKILKDKWSQSLLENMI